MTGDNRNHIIYILVMVAKFIKALGFLVIVFLLNINLISTLIALGVICVLILFGFLLWIKTTYAIDNEMIILNKGILAKTNITLPLNKISTVDQSQNPIFQLLGVVRLKLDSDSANNLNEIDLYLPKEKAEKIADTIKNRSYNNAGGGISTKDESTINKKTVYFKELIIYGLVKSNLVFVLGLIFTISAFLDDISNLFHFDLSTVIDQNIPETAVVEFTYITVIFLITIILIAILATKLLSIIMILIKYYDYQVERNEDQIRIKYGIIQQKNYSFSLKKINIIQIKQNMLMKIFRLYTVKIIATGYGDEDKEEALLYPVCNKIKLDEVINELLPEFMYTGDILGVPKRARRMFFIIPLIFTVVIVLGLSYFFKYGYTSIIIIPLCFLYCMMKERNTTVGISEKLIYASSGGFHKTINISFVHKVQAVESKHHFFQRRKNVKTYLINYFGNQTMNISHMESEYYNDFKNVLLGNKV